MNTNTSNTHLYVVKHDDGEDYSPNASILIAKMKSINVQLIGNDNGLPIFQGYKLPSYIAPNKIVYVKDDK